MKNSVGPKRSPNQAMGARIIAGIIDIALWTVVFIVAGLTFGTSTGTISGSAKGTSVSLSGMPLITFIMAELAYFVILEWRFGATVGKLLLGVRVVGEGGEPITLRQSAIRNFMRVIDAFPYIVPYLTGLILVAGDEHKHRLGDRAAGTEVVLRVGRRRASDWSAPA